MVLQTDVTEVVALDDVELSRFDANGYSAGVPKRCSVQVTPEGLVIDGALALRRADVSSGMIRRELPGIAVELHHRDARKTVLKTDTLSDARAILRALEADGAHAAMTFSAPSPVTRGFAVLSTFLIPLAMAPGMFRDSLATSYALAGAVFLALVILSAFATKVTVGLDLVLIRWFVFRRSVPIPSIRSLEVTDNALRIHHGDNKVVSVPTRTGIDMRHELPDRAALRTRGARRLAEDIAERIDEASHADGIDPNDGAALPERGAKSVAEWLSELRALASRQGPRDPAFIPERLWRLIGSASTRPATRITAAVALAPSLDEEGLRRLRVIANATVSPKVRVALVSAADTNDESLVTVLEEIERERA